MFSSILRSAIVAASLVTITSAQENPVPIPSPTVRPVALPPVDKGCFDSPGPLLNYGPSTYQSIGNCQPICVGLGKAVMAMTGASNCLCGDMFPPKSNEVDVKECNLPCQGYPADNCGGRNTYRVYQSGLDSDEVLYADSDEAASSSAASSGSEPTSVSQETAVVTVTNGAAPTINPDESDDTDEENQKKRGPNTVGIAVGVVVGVVVAAALVGGAILFLKRRRRQQAEDDYRRRASLKEFHGKPPGTGHSSLTDTRLDPEIMMRRQSDGSIADNQDYSRRILQVRNL